MVVLGREVGSYERGTPVNRASQMSEALETKGYWICDDFLGRDAANQASPSSLLLSSLELSDTKVYEHLRFQAKSEHIERVPGLLPESQGQNVALTVLCVPYSLDNGMWQSAHLWQEARVSVMAPTF